MEKQKFLEIIDSHKGLIRSLCKIYFVREEDQKDAFQDIVLQLWNSITTFRGDSEVGTWIYRVGLNTILSQKRKEKKHLIIDSMDNLEQDIKNTNADDDLELLHLIIQSLGDQDKAIVVLHLEGYKNKEIAEILKISSSNVSTRFNRIRSHLKTKYQSNTHATK